jgi:hypothetical protein
MELLEFSELYDRIQTNPSILMLGQQYLTMGDQKDPVWQKLQEEIYPELNLSRRKTNYPQLWEAAVRKDADAAATMEKIAQVSSAFSHNAAIAAVLKPIASSRSIPG